MPVWVLAIYTLAAARLTGLITADDITRTAQTAVLNWLPNTSLGRAAGTLVTCQWCASIWVAAVVAPVAWWWADRPWFAIPAFALAASQVTGMLSDLGRN
jgi:hypothetical protein